jgi:hypothetical protein
MCAYVRACGTSPYALLHTAIVYLSYVVGPFVYGFECCQVAQRSPLFCFVVSRDPHVYVYLNVLQSIPGFYRSYFTELLGSFGFDFLLTLFKEFPVKGNLKTNVLDILSSVARRIFRYFAKWPALNSSLFYQTSDVELSRVQVMCPSVWNLWCGKRPEVLSRRFHFTPSVVFQFPVSIHHP